MDDESNDPTQRVAAFNLLREARKAMQRMIEDATNRNDTQPLYAKLKVWLVIVTEGEEDMSNLLSTRHPNDHVGELRQVASKMRLLGRKQTDEVATLIERAISKITEF